EVSPAVSRIAREQGISLRELLAINGSGEGGRVTKRDLERYLKTRRAVIPSPGPAESVGFPAESPPAPAPSAPSPAPALSTLSKPATEPVTTGWSTPDEVTLGQTLPMTPMRAAIAEHMVRSKQTSPHVTSIAEVDMSRVIAYRQANREVFARQGVNLTYTAFFVQAAVEALRRYPLANASLVDNKIVIHPRVNVGVAVALENGLIVPVVKRAENLSLKGLAAAINDLATRARQKKLSHDDVRDGTFTVTNPGMQGVLFGTAIINQPQAAILGVGAIAERVIALNGAIAIRPMVYLSLTYDHRIMDGAGANFVIVAIRDFLQNYPLV
ncbi:MAG TPA: 2-oxo acid dehydrogenase subunit E2, partial [Chloroflexi bacterium]|nr:2-oxo acid dehydrogenase subunit E2 [Chloroflexota bacterium]